MGLHANKPALIMRETLHHGERGFNEDIGGRIGALGMPHMRPRLLGGRLSTELQIAAATLHRWTAVAVNIDPGRRGTGLNKAGDGTPAAHKTLQAVLPRTAFRCFSSQGVRLCRPSRCCRHFEQAIAAYCRCIIIATLAQRNLFAQSGIRARWRFELKSGEGFVILSL